MGYKVVGFAKISKGEKAINLFFTEGNGKVCSLPLTQIEELINSRNPEMSIDIRQYEKIIKPKEV
jgi:hypothetical protein